MKAESNFRRVPRNFSKYRSDFPRPEIDPAKDAAVRHIQTGAVAPDSLGRSEARARADAVCFYSLEADCNDRTCGNVNGSDKLVVVNEQRIAHSPNPVR